MPHNFLVSGNAQLARLYLYLKAYITFIKNLIPHMELDFYIVEDC